MHLKSLNVLKTGEKVTPLHSPYWFCRMVLDKASPCRAAWVRARTPRLPLTAGQHTHTRIYLMSHSGFGRSFCRPVDVPCPICRPPLLFGVFSFIITSEAKGMCYFTRSYIQTFPAHPSVLHGSCSSCACRITAAGFWTVLLCTRIYLMSHSGFGRSFCRPGDVPCPSAVHLYCSVCSALSFPVWRQRECATSLEIIFRLPCTSLSPPWELLTMCMQTYCWRRLDCVTLYSNLFDES